MTLSELRALAAARTAKSWRYWQLVDGIEARALIDGNGYLFGRIDDLQNGEWIEAMNNHADALLDVVDAALDCESYYGGDEHSGPINRLKKALKAIEGVK